MEASMPRMSTAQPIAPQPRMTKQELLGKLLELERRVVELAEIVEGSVIDEDNSTIASASQLYVQCGIGAKD
jgi:hypothetical protein